MSKPKHSTGRPRLLLLSQVLPYPPDTGVSVRTYNTLRLLAERFDVTMLAFSRAAAHTTAEDRHSAAEELARIADTGAFPIPQESSRARYLWDHLRSVLTRSPYTRFVYDSREYREAVREALEGERWDIVQIESLDLYGYLPDLPEGLPVVLVHHNVESQLLARRADVTRNPLAAWYLGHQARLLEREERRWCGRVDLNVTVSRADAEILERLAPAGDYLVVPNGVDTRFFSPPDPRPERRNGVVFLGGTEWLPNKDGLEFFCTEILGPLRERVPGLPVHWVGRSSPEERRYYQDRYDVTLTGYVDDVRPYIAEAHCSVVPLRFGGGTRLKITTAWAMGSAIVSTSLGCEGLDARDGENILVRDDPRAFAHAIAEVVGDAELRSRLEKEGRTTALEEYGWDVIGRRMIPRFDELLSTHTPERVQ